jgi:hypothetical protein
MAPTELPGNSSGCFLGYPPPYSVPPDPTLQEPSAAPAQLTTTGTPHRGRAHTAPQISTNMATMPNLLLNPQAVPLPSTHTPTSLRPQYEYKDRSDDYQAYKIRRGIQGGILILISQIQRHSPQEEIYPANAPPITDDTFIHNIFLAYTPLPFETPDISLFRRLIAELHKHSLISTPLEHPFSITHTSTLEASTIYEDNVSCIVLAHSEGTKVRTKHISLKWHRFKDHIRAGDLKVVKIDTNLNWADIFTKPLCKVKHESLWHFIMGW